MTTNHLPLLRSAFFPILEGTLYVNVTDEGIICDVVNSDGEVISTWGATAQEMADDFCH